MKLPLLVDAICQAFMKGVQGGIWEPRQGMTYCNEAVSFISSQLDYKKFNGLLANQMIDLMKTNGEWQDVAVDAAQFHANQGALVLAGWKNPDGHGHICVVMPGIPEDSLSWGSLAPKVMNIGETNFIGKRASFAFSKDHKPQFFALKSMI